MNSEKISAAFEKVKQSLYTLASEETFPLVVAYLDNETKLRVLLYNEHLYTIAVEERTMSVWNGERIEANVDEDDDGNLTLESQVKVLQALQLELPYCKDEHIANVRYVAIQIGDYGADGLPEYTDINLAEEV